MGGDATRFTRRSQGVSDLGSLGDALAASFRAQLEGARWHQGKDRTLSGLDVVDEIA